VALAEYRTNLPILKYPGAPKYSEWKNPNPKGNSWFLFIETVSGTYSEFCTISEDELAKNTGVPLQSCLEKRYLSHKMNKVHATLCQPPASRS
jgi:hypothetical protein